MKRLILFLCLMVSVPVFAQSTSSLEQLEADKAHVIQAELARLERLAGTPVGLKSLNTECPDDPYPRPHPRPRPDHERPPEPYCQARLSNGTCYIYGEDRPGPCYPNCVGRLSNGECYIYGPDVCQ